MPVTEDEAAAQSVSPKSPLPQLLILKEESRFLFP
jgi:hypothetical protein